MSRLLHANSHKIPKRAHVSPIVSRPVNRRLQNKRPPRQALCPRTKPRMIQNPPKRLQPDLPAPDVLVPVHPRTERRLRIVDVQDVDSVEPQDAIRACNRGLEAALRADVVPSLKRVRGV